MYSVHYIVYIVHCTVYNIPNVSKGIGVVVGIAGLRRCSECT